MENYCRTDLAAELFGAPDRLPRCVVSEVDITPSGFKKERHRLSSEYLGKPAGDYLTIYCGHVHELDDDAFFGLARDLALELSSAVERVTEKNISPDLSVLVAGLGNRELTPDALGPGAVELINATLHLADASPELFSSLGCCRLSAIAPGVLGQTGIEAADIIRGAVEATRPDIVIAIDALAAGELQRLVSTIQLGDSGIRPGSGVQNHRSALDRESLGVPVLALGAPTVVDSAAIVFDALRKAGIEDPSNELLSVLNNGRSFFVAPKDADTVVKSLCRLFADAVNIAFGINLESRS